MKCGLRSQAAGIKSRRPGDRDVIISETFYGSAVYSARARHFGMGVSSMYINSIGCHVADVAIDRSIEVRTGDVGHRFHQNSQNSEKVRQLLLTMSCDMRDRCDLKFNNPKNLEILSSNPPLSSPSRLSHAAFLSGWTLYQ
jgi:hypothetical protein